MLQKFIIVLEPSQYDWASKRLERIGATHDGILAALGAKLVQFTRRPEITFSLVVGTMLGVLKHTALTLAAGAKHQLTTQAWHLWRHGKCSTSDDMRSDLFTVASFIEDKSRRYFSKDRVFPRLLSRVGCPLG